ncbi:efflux RND transporter periplasmic adaptor subunit [Tabrizicola sp. TH137]|uniref:efflux RND transporter periplasmic adaptor subunit n=1 Tax=Tabrizicola sp. TH137 TaxID=2067452 RepID=UPI000C7AA9BC|nr:efflux RND transporter periplasmic adaptor subunit [Tabrizicola sp. TH137]PLL12713.1 efflux RND transporter periplasmic adaptor subunit [Tabrizicola sp. TH137]
MSIWKQSVLSLVLLVGAVLGMAALLPSANAALRGFGLGGVLDLVGLEMAEPKAEAGRGGAGGGSRGPAMVVALPPGEGRIADRVTAIGDGRAIRSVMVAPETPGRVTEVLVQSGQPVQAGDILLRLDSEAERIAVERARLVLDDARAALERLQQLQGSGASSGVQLREAELALRQAELELRQAEFDLSLREVPAPVSGYVGILGVEVGAQVGTTTEIAQIDDRSVLLVDFRLPERMVGRIAPGDAVMAEAMAGGFAAIEGRVSAIDNRVDAASRTLRVQARLDNADDRLRAGMSFVISVDMPGEPAPAVSPLSVQWSRDGAFVWVVREGKAARLPIRILQRSEAEVLVEAEFAPGDLVVVEGVQAVRPGAEVQVVGEDATAVATTSAPASL